MEVSLTEADSVIIVAHHLPLRVERAPDGNGFSIGWDDERGLDKNGMKLPTETMYIGCIELDVPDLDEQEALEKRCTLLCEAVQYPRLAWERLR